MDLYLCSFYVGRCTVYVFLLSRCHIAICFVSFALCYVLINCFINFHYSFYVCFLVLYVVLSVLYVLCFCSVLCIVSSRVYCCLFSICVQLYRPLPPGGNPIAVNKYRIVSCSTTYITISHYRFISYNLKLSHLRNVCNTHEKKFLVELRGMYVVIRHLPSPFWSQWCFSCHHTVNGRFMFR
jgi:hypothetical protein